MVEVFWDVFQETQGWAQGEETQNQDAAGHSSQGAVEAHTTSITTRNMAGNRKDAKARDYPVFSEPLAQSNSTSSQAQWVTSPVHRLPEVERTGNL